MVSVNLFKDIDPGCPPYTENAYDRSAYIKCTEKCFSYNFRTFSNVGWKKLYTNLCGCSVLLKKESGGKKKVEVRVFFAKECSSSNSLKRNLHDYNFLMVTRKFFPSNFEIALLVFEKETRSFCRK